MNIVFFVGKGGVGKSTNSAIFAVKRAMEGHRVLLNSIDPAHNLHDIFLLDFAQRPRDVLPGLAIMETDLDYWVKRYLKEMEGEFKNVYRYLEVFNLHKFFKILKFSPGIEEYAVLIALEDAINAHPDADYLIFDTPPTALTLRILALPQISLLWLRELQSFRQKILDKKEIVTKIRQGKRLVQNDPVLSRINDLIARYESLVSLFKDHDKTSAVIVLNHDPLSLAESRDIFRELTELGMSIPRIILNKFDGRKEYSETLGRHFKAVDIYVCPAFAGEVTGLERLKAIDSPVLLETV